MEKLQRRRYGFGDRPVASVVALFSGLNLTMVLLASLFLVTENARGGKSPVLFQPLALLTRVAVACLVFGLLLYFLRPGGRSLKERGVLVLFGVGVVALLTIYVDPLLSLALVPFAARYWLTLKETLIVAAALFAWSMLWGLTLGRLGGTNPPLVTIVVFLVLAVIFGGYALMSFEFAVREARAREEARTFYDELQRSYQQLKNYRELELQHASLSERHRLSRELHDTLGHDLTAQRFDLEVLNKRMPDDETARGALERALARNAEAMGNLKRTVRALRPERLEQVTLSEALRHLVSLAPHNERVTLSIEGAEGVLDAETRLTLYRIVQETLTNAAKHAPSEVLNLHVQFLCGHIELSADNLFESRDLTTPNRGLGLQGLRERVENLQGRFYVSCEGGRFRLWASLPRQSA